MDARDRAVVKAAARITYTDMGVIRRNLRETLKLDYWAGFARMPTSGWEEQGHTLAGVLAPREYEAVAHTFARAADVEHGFQAMLRAASAHRGPTRGGVEVISLTDESKSMLEKLLDDAQKACELLGAIAYEDDELAPDMESHRDPSRP